MADVTLLPCPSGHTEGATKSPRSNGAYWEIVCSADGCGWSVAGDTEADAAFAWNTRPAPALTPKQAAADEMFDALKALVKECPAVHCDAFHHGKADRHDGFVPCPPLLRYEAAKAKAESALAKAGQP